MRHSEHLSKKDTARLARNILAGLLVVMPTDTIYGIVCSALNKKSVQNLYRTRKRNPEKPFIVLLSRLADLKKFGISITRAEKATLGKVWPGAVSVVLSCPHRKFRFLHRGTGTLAFRIPKSQWLRRLLAKTGPLTAPSANLEGQPPAQTIAQAEVYFENSVSAYVDGGVMQGKPSTLVKLIDSKFSILRQGTVAIPKRLCNPKLSGLFSEMK